MVWTVEVEAEAQNDLDYAYGQWFDYAAGLGQTRAEAARSTRIRLNRTLDGLGRIANAPYIGTLHDDLRPGLRHVTLDDAVYWFELDADRHAVRILGIFHGGQDHLGRMLARLTAEGGAPPPP